MLGYHKGTARCCKSVKNLSTTTQLYENHIWKGSRYIKLKSHGYVLIPAFFICAFWCHNFSIPVIRNGHIIITSYYWPVVIMSLPLYSLRYYHLCTLKGHQNLQMGHMSQTAGGLSYKANTCNGQPTCACWISRLTSSGSKMWRKRQNTKVRVIWGGYGHLRSSAISPFDTAHAASSYSPSIVPAVCHATLFCVMTYFTVLTELWYVMNRQDTEPYHMLWCTVKA